MAAKAKKPPAIDPGLMATITPDSKTRAQWAKWQLRRDKELLASGWSFDTVAADHVCDFFQQFVRHSKGEWAGKPIVLEEWQVRILRRLFGWKRPDGTRRYRKAHLKIGRKNGKSLLAAGVGLYLAFADGEDGADVYSAAVDKGQALLVFDEACNMVDKSPALKSRLQVYRGRAILKAQNLSSYKPLSKESQNKDGLNIHGTIRDEIHEWTDREFVAKIGTAQGSRRQPMQFDATTAGDDPASIWGEEDDYAHKVADGTIPDDEYLPVLYEAEAKDNWKSMETWRKANPNLGISVKLDFIESQFRDAIEKPSHEPVFKRYHLNLMTQKFGRWMRMDKWDRCGGKIDYAALKGQPCWCALDLSTRTDMTAAAWAFPDGDLVRLLVKVWVPEAVIDAKEKRDRIPLRLWIRQGLVEATPGDVIDYAHIRRAVVQSAQIYDLQEVAYDPVGATQLALQLQDEDGITCFEHSQSMMKMSEPTKMLEARVLQRVIRHGGNPVLRWMVGNAIAFRDANDNVKVMKHKSTGRIDGAIAVIMAQGRATLGEDGTSVYEARGIRTL